MNNLTLPTNLLTLMTTYWNHIIATIIAIYNYIEIKVFGAIMLPIYCFFFNPELSQLALALFFLIAFDMITGIYSAKKNGEKIESKKAVKTAFKLAVYGILISTMHLTDLTLQISQFNFNLEIGMIGFLAATEAISVIENAGKLGYAIPKKLLNVLTDFTNKK